MMELPKDVGSDMLDMKLNERTPCTDAKKTFWDASTPSGKSTWKQEMVKYQVVSHCLNHDYGRKGVHSREQKAGTPNIGGWFK